MSISAGSMRSLTLAPTSLPLALALLASSFAFGAVRSANSRAFSPPTRAPVPAERPSAGSFR